MFDRCVGRMARPSWTVLVPLLLLAGFVVVVVVFGSDYFSLLSPSGRGLPVRFMAQIFRCDSREHD